MRTKKTEKAERPKGKPIKTIIVFDLGGYGYSIVWTLDGVTWIGVSRSPLNAAERDGYLRRYRDDYPQATIREVTDFYCRIPDDLVVEGTRVI